MLNNLYYTLVISQELFFYKRRKLESIRNFGMLQETEQSWVLFKKSLPGSIDTLGYTIEALIWHLQCWGWISYPWGWRIYCEISTCIEMTKRQNGKYYEIIRVLYGVEYIHVTTIIIHNQLYCILDKNTRNTKNTIIVFNEKLSIDAFFW